MTLTGQTIPDLTRLHDVLIYTCHYNLTLIITRMGQGVVGNEEEQQLKFLLYNLLKLHSPITFEPLHYFETNILDRPL